MESKNPLTQEIMKYKEPINLAFNNLLATLIDEVVSPMLAHDKHFDGPLPTKFFEEVYMNLVSLAIGSAAQGNQKWEKMVWPTVKMLNTQLNLVMKYIFGFMMIFHENEVAELFNFQFLNGNQMALYYLLEYINFTAVMNKSDAAWFTGGEPLVCAWYYDLLPGLGLVPARARPLAGLHEMACDPITRAAMDQAMFDRKTRWRGTFAAQLKMLEGAYQIHQFYKCAESFIAETRLLIDKDAEYATNVRPAWTALFKLLTGNKAMDIEQVSLESHVIQLRLTLQDSSWTAESNSAIERALAAISTFFDNLLAVAEQSPVIANDLASDRRVPAITKGCLAFTLARRESFVPRWIWALLFTSTNGTIVRLRNEIATNCTLILPTVDVKVDTP